MSESARTTGKKRQRKTAESYLANEFYSDCTASGMLFGALVRSPYAYGKITNVIIDLPEDYRLYTARDIPGENTIRTLNASAKIFSTGEVQYIGEPVGIIVGPDLQTARRLASEAELTFAADTIEAAARSLAKEYRRPFIPIFPPSAQNDEKIPLSVFKKFLADGEEAPIQKNYCALHERPHTRISGGRSVVIAERVVRTGFFQPAADKSANAADEFYQAADYDVAGTWTHQESPVAWMEPSGAFCTKKGQKITVMTTTQWPEHLKAAISRALKLDAENITVRKTRAQPPNVSGLWRRTTLAVQAAVAAYLCGSPVLLMLTREEQRTFMDAGLKTALTYRSAADKSGRIQAMKITIDANAGAANPFAPEIADRLAAAAAGFYDIENMYIAVRMHTSDNPPTSFYPESADAPVFFALENHVQQIALRAGLMPDEIRFRNIAPDDVPEYSPFIVKIHKAPSAVQTIMRQSDFGRKYASLHLDRAGPPRIGDGVFRSLPRRGVGLAWAYGGSCFFGSMFNAFDQKMEATLETDGTFVINATEPPPHVAKIWKKIAAGMLGLEEAAVQIKNTAGTQRQPSIPDNLYNNISIMTLLLKRCCTEIQKKRFRIPLPITSKKAVTPAMKRQWNAADFCGSPFHATAFGCAIAEVEFNADTYMEKINGIWIAIDCGEILSVKSAENAVRLAVQQELERLVQNETAVCDHISISFMQSNNPPAQIGGIVRNIVPAAFTLAMSQALSAPVTELPCTQEQFYRLAEDAAAAARSAAAKEADAARSDKTEGEK